jgi:hypothetical protein
MMKRLLMLQCLLWSSLSAASLSLIPSGGELSGALGSTVGWGFSIDNDTLLYLVVTSATPMGFDPLTGSYQDFISSVNFTVASPNSVLTQPYGHLAQTGFGEFAILSTATSGEVTGATFFVSYDLLVNDPNGPIGGDPGDRFGLVFPSFDGSIRVPSGSGVPEPSTGLLSGLAWAALWCVRRRARKGMGGPPSERGAPLTPSGSK